MESVRLHPPSGIVGLNRTLQVFLYERNIDVETAKDFAMTKQFTEIVIYKSDLVYAKHAYIPEGHEMVYLGWLIIEPIRKVYGLDELNSQEAQEVGLLITRLSRALKKVERAEHIYSFVIGHQASQLHIHIVPRYPNTPREYWGMRVDEWPDAPKGDLLAIRALAKRISNYLEKE